MFHCASQSRIRLHRSMRWHGVDHRIRVKNAVVADFDVRTDEHTRINPAVVADLRVVTDGGEAVHITIGTQRRRVGYVRMFTDAHTLVAAMTVQYDNDLLKSIVGILGYQQWDPAVYLFVDNNRRSLCRLYKRQITLAV